MAKSHKSRVLPPYIFPSFALFCANINYDNVHRLKNQKSQNRTLSQLGKGNAQKDQLIQISQNKLSQKKKNQLQLEIHDVKKIKNAFKNGSMLHTEFLKRSRVSLGQQICVQPNRALVYPTIASVCEVISYSQTSLSRLDVIVREQSSINL